MELTWWLQGFAGLAVGAAIICNLPTRLWLPSQKATLEHLAKTTLQAIDGATAKKSFQEAVALSSLKPQLDAANVRLYGVVHETFGVKGFQPFFKGEIFLDTERRFYGPRERWMGISGFIRPSVWMSIFRAKGKNIEGDMKGEGRLLGGVYVIGPGESGVFLEHRESEFGDHANLDEIMDAIKRMQQA